ncbi:MAG: hypothetical protein QM572_03115 [Nocardioides sp.]|uniref:hypothetical protein n=1 Tax=Nocardioides sp. TaxID=35761 RepID=UPI0039E35D78
MKTIEIGIATPTVEPVAGAMLLTWIAGPVGTTVGEAEAGDEADEDGDAEPPAEALDETSADEPVPARGLPSTPAQPEATRIRPIAAVTTRTPR